MGKGTEGVTVTDQFVFFWRGYLSQFFRCSFLLDGVHYTHAEQAMMAEKARLFGDEDTRQKILAAQKPNEHKAFGRQVKNFDQAKWDAHCLDIVIRVNTAKFSQDAELK